MAGPRTIATWTPRLLNIFPSTTYLLSGGPCGKGCACWAAIARQIALGLFPLRLWPRPPHLRDAVSNSFHRTLEVRGNKHPRFTGLDEIEQSPILLGCPICSAVLHSHQNTLISSPSLSSPFERDFVRSIFSLMARERTACSVRFNCIPISRALTSVSANERSHSSSSGVHGLIFFPAAVIAALFLRLQPQL